ncbi:MAG: PD40 domain-containing protein [Firmicutes bacterium]|nr:PD40 domain-containing protein [Bacillota bacterium]
MKIGVQLFGVLRDRQGKVWETLGSLADAGIRVLEPCVSPKAIPGFDHVIWSAAWLGENMDRIRSMGFEIRSIHLMARDLSGIAPLLKDLAAKTGFSQVVLKSPRELSDVMMQQSALQYMKLADELEEAGIQVLLHNEGTDISTKIGGKTAYEHMLDLCLGKVQAQVDVGWIVYAGEDVKDFLWRNAFRVRSLHYKDYPENAAEPKDTAIGTGALDIRTCVRFARANNVPQIIDQEHFEDPGKELGQICGIINSYKMDWQDTVSYINTYDITTGQIKTLVKIDMPIESPNWLKNSDRMLIDGKGKLYFFYPKTGELKLIETGGLAEFGNAHVPSPDEKLIAASCGFTNTNVYVMPIEGGEPICMTDKSPSYFHGWSPDGKYLIYLGYRDDMPGALNIFRRAVDGGEEVRITNGGFHDGPEYSPDGQYIWCNANYSGNMQIWRIKADGSEATQMSRENGRVNMFPHISPDGKKVVFTSYPVGCLEETEHLPDVPVEIWMMNSDGSDMHRILSLFGGHGVMHVNTWSGDSKSFAFVSYEMKN